MAFLVANGFAQSLATVSTALLVQHVFDHYIRSLSALTSRASLELGAGFLASAGAIAWLRMRERVDAERLGQDYARECRLLLYDHMSRMTPRSLQSKSSGTVMLRFIGDLNALRQWVSLGLARLVVGGVTAVGTLSALAFVSPVLALVVGLALTSGMLTLLATGHRLEKAVREARRRRSHLAANVNEKISTMAVVQAFGQTKKERKRIKRQNNRLHDAMIDRARAAGRLRGIAELTGAMTSAAVLLIGAVAVSLHDLTPGTVVAALSIVGLLLPALRDLSRVYEYWQGASVSNEKIRAFLQQPIASSATG